MAKQAKEKDKEEEFDESALAALVRPSLAPAVEEEPDAGDDGVLDLRALASSMVLPASEASAAAETPAANGGNGASPSAAESAPKSTAAAMAASTASDVAASKPASVDSKSTAAAPSSAAPSSAAPAVTAAPAASEKKGSGMWIGAVLVLGIGAAAAYFALGGPATDADPVAANSPPSTNTPSTEPTGAAGASDQDEAPSEAAAVEEAVPEEAAAEEATEEAASEEAATEAAAVEAAAQETAVAGRPTAVRPGVASRPTSDPAMATVMEAPTMEATMEPAATMETAMAAETPAASMALDDMLNMALGGRPVGDGSMTQMATAMEEAPPSADLPETPSRANVARTLGRLLPQIRQCAGEQVGLANAAVIVNSDGSVASVNISGSPFGGTPQGACMEGVIRRARFAPFRSRTFRLSYPFAIRPQL